MQHTNSALTGHGNGHAGFSHRVHRCGQKWRVRADAPRKSRHGVGLGGNNVRMGRQEHHIVVGQAYEIEGIVLHPVAPRTALRRLGTTASRRNTMVPVHTPCQKPA